MEALFLKALTSFFTGFLTGQGSAPTFSVNAVEEYEYEDEGEDDEWEDEDDEEWEDEE